jgi:hypothetical protein
MADFSCKTCKQRILGQASFDGECRSCAESAAVDALTPLWEQSGTALTPLWEQSGTAIDPAGEEAHSRSSRVSLAIREFLSAVCFSGTTPSDARVNAVAAYQKLIFMVRLNASGTGTHDSVDTAVQELRMRTSATSPNVTGDRRRLKTDDDSGKSTSRTAPELVAMLDGLHTRTKGRTNFVSFMSECEDRAQFARAVVRHHGSSAASNSSSESEAAGSAPSNTAQDKNAQKRVATAVYQSTGQLFGSASHKKLEALLTPSIATETLSINSPEACVDWSRSLVALQLDYLFCYWYCKVPAEEEAPRKSKGEADDVSACELCMLTSHFDQQVAAAERGSAGEIKTVMAARQVDLAEKIVTHVERLTGAQYESLTTRFVEAVCAAATETLAGSWLGERKQTDQLGRLKSSKTKVSTPPKPLNAPTVRQTRLRLATAAKVGAPKRVRTRRLSASAIHLGAVLDMVTGQSRAMQEHGALHGVAGSSSGGGAAAASSAASDHALCAFPVPAGLAVAQSKAFSPHAVPVLAKLSEWLSNYRDPTGSAEEFVLRLSAAQTHYAAPGTRLYAGLPFATSEPDDPFRGLDAATALRVVSELSIPQSAASGSHSTQTDDKYGPCEGLLDQGMQVRDSAREAMVAFWRSAPTASPSAGRKRSAGPATPVAGAQQRRSRRLTQEP